jgi:GxxExxY protein
MRDEALTEAIIGAAHRVLYALKPGLEEKLYERALAVDFSMHQLAWSSQQPFDVSYEGVHVGTLVPDLIVERRVLIETKVVTDFTDTHLAQVLGYLNITGLKTALLLKFKYARLGIKRMVL